VRRIAYALAAALIAACTALPVQRAATGTQGAFELTGRIAVRYGKEGASGRIAWRHSADDDEMLFTSPIGQGIATITRRDGEVRLVTSDQKEYRAHDAESLTERVLGWRLPLTGLPDWVQGRADPARPAELERDGQSRLTQLRQDDWKVEYQEYEGARPSKLKLSRADIEIRLVVDDWLSPR